MSAGGITSHMVEGRAYRLSSPDVAGRGRPALHQQDWIAFRLASSRQHSLAYNRGMANLILVYGLRLLPSDEVEAVV